MMKSGTPRLKIDEQILVIDRAICGHINRFGASERGVLAQTILQQLRTLVEHIMLKVYSNGRDIDITYPNICAAIDFVKTRGELKFLRRFHNALQIVVSHYIQDEESSERLMLKYYESLLKIREFLKVQYSLEILGNLDKFPINTDSELKEYYKKIADRVNSRRVAGFSSAQHERFYVRKVKPFIVGQRIYYEVTFTLANEKASKFDRTIAFTDLDISQFYAAKLYIVHDSIEILGKTMPVRIIVDWEVSIRPCELVNFSKIFNADLKIASGNAEYRELMQYLTETGFNLIELIDFPNAVYSAVKQKIARKSTSLHFIDILDQCRAISQRSSAGSRVIKYLLYHLNNKVIKLQYDRQNSNRYLSNLRLRNGCIPFDEMPFNTSLIAHNPKLSDLFECMDSTGREHELFARFIRNNTEIQGQLYTADQEIPDFKNVDGLIKKYNSSLWQGHSERDLEMRNNHVYIKGYQDDTLFIIKKLKELAQRGITNYANSVVSWLKSSSHGIDCDEKKQALTRMFENSRVVLIYGSAGTGKSTMINHVSHFFSTNSKLYLANTNPAVDNLKRRVTASNCTFATITKFVKNQGVPSEYDLLIVDECSTVSNRDMQDVLKKAKFKLLVLVGDIYQIESIRFGNWFGVARGFIPETAVFELTKPYRTKNADLLELWKRVRHMDEAVLEHLAKKGYSKTLDVSIFDAAEADEIILCLNYDGLYGINNINRFLQEANPNPAFQWGIQSYKVNDPVLFNESERFAPLIYNNTKGRIIGIKIIGDQIQFDIELDKVINEMDASMYDFTLLPDSVAGNSVIQFRVNKYKSTDDDDDISSVAVVPFQVAYAVSIHKAQGLEYNSVKVVITDEVDELISHNIFYTAITRAKNKLRIYWTPEVEQKVLSGIKPKSNTKDVALLRDLIH